MNTRTKKRIGDGVGRMEAGGEIKEILIQEDLMTPESARIQICFRGEGASGIVELTKEERSNVYSDVMNRAGLKKKTEVLMFKKQKK
jgi:hypothetical protein